MKKAFPFIVLVILAIAVLAIKNCTNTTPKPKKKDNTTDNVEATQRGLNRNPSNINYTKHAKCRMDCRKVSQAEVKEILINGTINYKKSDLKGEDCKKKYAVEGLSKDNQRLRIVFAPCGSEVTVITCIDLGTDWECSCEGEENN